MKTYLTRPKYVLAMRHVDPPLTHIQSEQLWSALRDVITGRLKPDPKFVHGWTQQARELLDPLRREIDACCKRHAEGTLRRQFTDYTGAPVYVTAGPGDSCAARTSSDARLPPVGLRVAPRTPGASNVLSTFDEYRAALVALRERMQIILHDEHHYRTVDSESTAPDPTPLPIIVANQRMLGQPAGCADWTHWESPTVRRRITQVFTWANATCQPRAKWMPYTVAVSSISDRGRAANARAVEAWRAALADDLRDTRDNLSDYASREQPGSPVALALAKRSAFFAELALNPQVDAAINDASTRQAQARLTPANAKFRPPNSIWHALTKKERMELAARYDELLRSCYELGHEASNPARMPNPWQLSEAELRDITG